MSDFIPEELRAAREGKRAGGKAAAQSAARAASRAAETARASRAPGEARPRRSLLALLGAMLRTVFSTRFNYQDALERQRAAALSAMCMIFGLLGAGGTIALNLFAPQLATSQMLLPNILLGLLYFVVYLNVQRGHLRRASIAFVILATIVPVVQNLAFNFLSAEAVFLSLAVPIVSAALLIGPVWVVPALALSLSGAGLVAYLRYQNALQTLEGAAQSDAISQIIIASIVGAFMLGVLGLFAWLLARSLFMWAATSLRRARQLEAAAVIAETAAATTSLSELLNLVVERIREAFGFYHAQVFLLDADGQLARLEASTGRAGAALLARGHALRLGSQSVVGQCTARGAPVVVNDTRASEVWRPNELLPDTSAELALPLLIGTNVIGALDVQSTTANVFQPEDIRSLSIMAQQLATTIEKTRLVDALQFRAAENQRLYEDAQTSLRQIEDLNRRLTREGWSEYLRVRHTADTLGYTLAERDVVSDTTWTAPMRQAYQGDSVVISRGSRRTSPPYRCASEARSLACWKSSAGETGPGPTMSWRWPKRWSIVLRWQ
jgi:GAF domain-containing protein